MAKKILIVDDEPDIVKMLAIRLKAHGFDIVAAHDGIQAVTVARRERPDLIILDIKFPAGGGYTVFENLKLSVDTMMIPVVFLSALPSAQVMPMMRKLQPDGYIAKPCEPQEIVDKIQLILSGE